MAVQDLVEATMQGLRQGVGTGRAGPEGCPAKELGNGKEREDTKGKNCFRNFFIF